MNKKFLSFATAFVSFVLPKLDNIKEIILYGSVARGESGADSDIDLFFNLENKTDEDKVKGILKRELKRFYKSKLAEQWVLQGIKNNFNLEIGNLDEWSLKRSIISEGIVLYGKYKEVPLGQKHCMLIILEPIKKIAKRNKIIRKIFGRYEKNYKIKGLIQDFNGRKLSPNSFIMPIEFSKQIIDFLAKEKVSNKIIEIWSDQV